MGLEHGLDCHDLEPQVGDMILKYFHYNKTKK